jgi:hypothetical protein
MPHPNRLLPALVAAVAATTLAVPAAAQRNDDGWTFEGSKDRFQTRAECQRAKKRAKARGTVAGAAVAGAGAAILGANLGETALVAGAGALVGRELGRNSKKC